jgi:hypothetical protein
MFWLQIWVVFICDVCWEFKKDLDRVRNVLGQDSQILHLQLSSINPLTFSLQIPSFYCILWFMFSILAVLFTQKVSYLLIFEMNASGDAGSSKISKNFKVHFSTSNFPISQNSPAKNLNKKKLCYFSDTNWTRILWLLYGEKNGKIMKVSLKKIFFIL